MRQITFGSIKNGDNFQHGGVWYKKIKPYHDSDFGTVNAITQDGKIQYFSTLELVYVS